MIVDAKSKEKEEKLKIKSEIQKNKKDDENL